MSYTKTACDICSLEHTFPNPWLSYNDEGDENSCPHEETIANMKKCIENLVWEIQELQSDIKELQNPHKKY